MRCRSIFTPILSGLLRAEISYELLWDHRGPKEAAIYEIIGKHRDNWEEQSMDVTRIIASRLKAVYFELEDGTLVMASNPSVESMSQQFGSVNTWSDIARDTQMFQAKASVNMGLECHPDEAGHVFYEVPVDEWEAKQRAVFGTAV